MKRTFLFAKSRGLQTNLSHTIYSEYSLNILCKFAKNIKVLFFFISFLENTCFVCNSRKTGPIEGALTSILKLSKVIPRQCNLFFSDFCKNKNVTLLSWNLNKLIKIGGLNPNIISPFSPCDYTRVDR